MTYSIDIHGNIVEIEAPRSFDAAAYYLRQKAYDDRRAIEAAEKKAAIKR